MVRLASLCVIVAACGPGLPSAGTETDAGSTGSTGATGASGSTTSSGTGGEASTSTSASTSATAEPTTSTSTGDGSSTSGATTGAVESSSGTSSGTTGEPAGTCCMVPDVGNAEVAGATPLGPIALTWAFFGIFGGECGGLDVHVYEDPSLLDTKLGPQLWINPHEVLMPPGKVPATFTVFDAQGQQVLVDGEIEVAAADEAHEPWWCQPGDPVVMTDATIELTFSIVADGWDVAGKVSALYCPQLNVFCP